MTSIVNTILEKNGSNPIYTTNKAEVATYNPIDRMNYVTLANVCEVASEIIFGCIKNGDGIGRNVGDVPLLKRDVTDMVASRIRSKIEDFNAARGAK